MIIDFTSMQTKSVLEGIVTQTILSYDSDSSNLKKGISCEVSFEGMLFRGYLLKVDKVSITSINKLSMKDIFLQGFLYKPHYLQFVKEQGFDVNETIVKVDFHLERSEV